MLYKNFNAAVRVLGEDLIWQIAGALVRGRTLHPVFAESPLEGADVVLEEAAELRRAAGSETPERQREEAKDVIVTGIRFLLGEHLEERMPLSENVEGTDPTAAPCPYARLREVLHQAFLQASEGKGRVRHGSDKVFEDQVSGRITDEVGPGYPVGQAVKKALESGRLEKDAAVRELLGSINYLALAIIKLEAI